MVPSYMRRSRSACSLTLLMLVMGEKSARKNRPCGNALCVCLLVLPGVYGGTSKTTRTLFPVCGLFPRTCVRTVGQQLHRPFPVSPRFFFFFFFDAVTTLFYARQKLYPVHGVCVFYIPACDTHPPPLLGEE